MSGVHVDCWPASALENWLKTDYNDSGEDGGDTDQDGSNASRDGETMKFRWQAREMETLHEAV